MILVMNRPPPGLRIVTAIECAGECLRRSLLAALILVRLERVEISFDGLPCAARDTLLIDFVGGFFHFRLGHFAERHL